MTGSFARPGPAHGEHAGGTVRPLQGVTVVVTRPRTAPPGPDGEPSRPGDRLADALEAAGAAVLPVPVIEIADAHDGGEALAAALRDLGRYRWVAFTSAHAVARTLARLEDVRDLAGVGIAAVGPVTAAALAGRGVVADLVARRPSAAGLASAFPPATPRPPGTRARSGSGSAEGSGGARRFRGNVEAPPRVLFPRAADARPTLPEGLREKGWEVDEVEAYRTVPAPAPAAALVPAIAAAEVVTFSSPSAVEAYRAMRTATGEPLPVPPVVACVGPVTAAAARAAGLEVAVESPGPDAASFVAALVAVLEDARGATPGGAPSP